MHRTGVQTSGVALKIANRRDRPADCKMSVDAHARLPCRRSSFPAMLVSFTIVIRIVPAEELGWLTMRVL